MEDFFRLRKLFLVEQISSPEAFFTRFPSSWFHPSSGFALSEARNFRIKSIDRTPILLVPLIRNVPRGTFWRGTLELEETLRFLDMNFPNQERKKRKKRKKRKEKKENNTLYFTRNIGSVSTFLFPVKQWKWWSKTIAPNDLNWKRNRFIIFVLFLSQFRDQLENREMPGSKNKQEIETSFPRGTKKRFRNFNFLLWSVFKKNCKKFSPLKNCSPWNKRGILFKVLTLNDTRNVKKLWKRLAQKFG